MNLKKLLGTGYFPKELPPPFETTVFAAKASYINRKWQKILIDEKSQRPLESLNAARRRFSDDFERYNSSKIFNYNISKGLLARRKLGVPNPKQYLDLCKIIVENWQKIKPCFKLSNFSASTPTEVNAKRSVRTISKTLNEFRFELIDRSFNKRFELKLDIAKFYNSVYTHSIPWAMLGKEDAKKYFKLKRRKTTWDTLITTDTKAALYEFCDKVDTLVRNCQDRQSVGLPIGPDTSFILAEIIGNRIDFEIDKALTDVDFSCTRFYDDYYFYTNNYNDIEQVTKCTYQILSEFNLETNESKTAIKELPFDFQSPWETTLNLYHFKTVNKYELRNFFTIIFQLIEKYPKDSNWIILHSLNRFQYGNTKIDKDNWDIFLSLLLKTQLIDPTNINQCFKILLSYQKFINKKSKEKISSILHEIIERNVLLSHGFEVSWSLWMLRSLRIKCSSKVLEEIFKSEDYVSKLICLDLINEKLLEGKRISKHKLIKSLSEDDFFCEKWLFTYESIKKGWLTPSSDLISKNKYFKLLFEYDVEFYNPNNQVTLDFILETPIQPRDKLKALFEKIKPETKPVAPKPPTDVKKDEEDIEFPSLY